ncbi:hypothetical protein GQ457_15G020830 [Hibiscus cannabinus]
MPGMINQAELVQQYCEVVLKQLRSQRPRNYQGRMSAQIFQPRPKDEITGRDINRIRIFFNIPNKARISKEAEIKSTSRLEAQSALRITWSARSAKEVLLY